MNPAKVIEDGCEVVLETIRLHIIIIFFFVEANQTHF
jgi:hypothetical protein